MIDFRKITLVLGAAVALVSGAAAQSTSYPMIPIKVIHPYAAGGTSDVVARIAAEKSAGARGQPELPQPSDAKPDRAVTTRPATCQGAFDLRVPCLFELGKSQRLKSRYH